MMEVNIGTSTLRFTSGEPLVNNASTSLWWIIRATNQEESRNEMNTDELTGRERENMNINLPYEGNNDARMATKPDMNIVK
jgi:hypothetical protein